MLAYLFVCIAFYVDVHVICEETHSCVHSAMDMIIRMCVYVHTYVYTCKCKWICVCILDKSQNALTIKSYIDEQTDDFNKSVLHTSYSINADNLESYRLAAGRGMVGVYLCMCVDNPVLLAHWSRVSVFLGCARRLIRLERTCVHTYIQAHP